MNGVSCFVVMRIDDWTVWNIVIKIAARVVYVLMSGIQAAAVN
jgi:hypothetical protein